MGWVVQDVLETLKSQLQLSLVLVNDSQTEVDLVGLVEIGVQLQDSDKGFFGILKRAVTVV